MKRAKKSNTRNALSWVSSLLLGTTFIFSGIVKAIDPLGTTYKIQDYFTTFGTFFEQFNSLAFFLAIALSTLEFVIGFSLFFRFKTKLFAIFALLFMIVMTPLTLYIAIENPVQDCGCFGDAIVLSNWATFAKNIVLLALAITLMCTLKNYHAFWIKPVEWIGIVVAVIIPVTISLYGYMHLPVIDFRPYKVGTNIAKSMEIPADAAPDVYETTFIYAKDGVEREFTLSDFPDESEGWMFIEQKTKLIKKGYEPPIHDFSIINAAGDDITFDVVEKQGFTFLLVAYDVNKANTDFAEKINAICEFALFSDVDFYALTASVDEDIEKYSSLTNATYEWCKTDPITLKTIIRANPGLVLIKDGTIVEKWNSRDIPSAKEMQEQFLLQNN